jgi:hypothetical protein
VRPPSHLLTKCQTKPAPPRIRIDHAHAEPDVLRFRLSLLTAAALIDGTIAALVGRYELEAEGERWRREVAARRRLRGTAPASCAEEAVGGTAEEARERRTAKAVRGVVRDVQDVLGISDVSVFSFGFSRVVRVGVGVLCMRLLYAGCAGACRRWFSSVDRYCAA